MFKSQGSSGQAVMIALDDILQDPEIQIFLLDEWNANLDAAHRATINLRLEKLAQAKAAVEVTYHSSITP